MLVIRISGMVNVPKKVQETLFRIGLRRKYAAIVMTANVENKKLINKIRNYVAYGNVKEDVLEKIILIRGQSKEKKKIDAKKVVKELGKKGLVKQGLKPFFRLHPPRGGIESKKHFGVSKGVLGDNKEKINDLVLRML